MALRGLVGQLRSKAPSLAQRLFGDCLDGALRYYKTETTLAKRALLCNVCARWDPAASSSKTMIVDKLSSRRGYSSEISLVDAENGSVVPGSLSCTDEGLEKNDSRKSEKSGPKISERHNLAMIFTCNVCQTRSAKTMSRQTYEQGVVIVRCGGCKNLHLIADRLGWFGEPGSVEDFLMQKGVEIRKGSEESYEFSMEDLAGWSPPGKE